ncbi:zinc ribbon domain-containing protein [candidate division KSB1 bacterium]|nr:zinc ribbon domain-containing protein [candidate division KSB1 bacterium]
MPIYEYRCNSCGRVAEIFARNAGEDVPPAVCACGKQAEFTKLLSAFAVAQAESGPCESGACQSELGGGGGCCGGHCSHGESWLPILETPGRIESASYPPDAALSNFVRSFTRHLSSPPGWPDLCHFLYAFSLTRRQYLLNLAVRTLYLV